MFSSDRELAADSLQLRGPVLADLLSAVECGRYENQTAQIAHMPRNSKSGGLVSRQLRHSMIGDRHLT